MPAYCKPAIKSVYSLRHTDHGELDDPHHIRRWELYNRITGYVLLWQLNREDLPPLWMKRRAIALNMQAREMFR